MLTLVTLVMSRLGELVMLSRINLKDEDDDSSSEASTPGTLSVPPSFEFERLDLQSMRSSSSSAMSTVFGTDSGGSSSRRTVSPSPKSNNSSSSHRSLHRRSSSQASVDQRKKRDDHLARWLQSGNVIYKGVGLGVSDLSVGMHLIEFARKKGVGSYIDGF